MYSCPNGRRVFSTNKDTSYGNYMYHKRMQVITNNCHTIQPNQPQDMQAALTSYMSFNVIEICSVYNALLQNTTVQQVITLIRDYNTNGTTTITLDMLNTILGQLQGLIYTNTTNSTLLGANSLTTSFMNSANVLYQISLLNTILNTTQNALEQTQHCCDILNDADLLREYLESLNSVMHALPPQTVNAPLATLKPQYALYIDQYGFPTNGSFDPELMAPIMQSLGL